MVWNYYTHGCIQTELGDWQAAYDYFTAALNCRIAAVKKEYQGLPRELVIHGGLGNASNGLGRHVEAERNYLKSLELFHQLADIPFEVYEVNICLCLLAQGPHRIAEASKMAESFIQRREEAYGLDDTVDFV